MKSGIHPDYVDDHRASAVAATPSDPQHQEERTDQRRGLLAVPPVLHRQAEDPRQRRTCRALREALRQARRQGREPRRRRQLAVSADARLRSIAGRASVFCRLCGNDRRAERTWHGHPASGDRRHPGRARRPRAAAGRSGPARRPAAAAQGRQAVRRARADHGDLPKLQAARGDLEAARELAADDESFAAEVPELEAQVAELDTHSPICSRPATRTTATTSCSR